MRAYIGVTASEIQEFLQSGEFDVSDAYAATPTFISGNSDLDEEEVEYTLSLQLKMQWSYLVLLLVLPVC